MMRLRMRATVSQGEVEEAEQRVVREKAMAVQSKIMQ
jgi:hypothetical protein